MPPPPRLRGPSPDAESARSRVAESVAEQVAGHLSQYLGPLNARVAVKTFAQRALNRGPETVTASDLPALLEALRPMLNTFVGSASANALLDDLRRRVR